MQQIRCNRFMYTVVFIPKSYFNISMYELSRKHDDVLFYGIKPTPPDNQ